MLYSSQPIAFATFLAAKSISDAYSSGTSPNLGASDHILESYIMYDIPTLTVFWNDECVIFSDWANIHKCMYFII